MPELRLLDHDPELMAALSPADAERARDGVRVRELTRSRGVLGPDVSATEPGGLGVLVLEGAVAAGTEVAARPAIELLGEGDLLQGEGRATALTDVRLAVLDRAATAAMAPWPELAGALVVRVARRTRRLHLQLALSGIPQVDTRLLLLFWHLADRWGRVTPEGVAVTVPLSHRLLAACVGARRPSVTSGLLRLREAGLIEHRGGAEWLLHGDRPPELGSD